MNVTIKPSTIGGTVQAIASKSVAHRAIICAAFADKPTHVICNTTCEDIESTIACLVSLGVQIDTCCDGFIVTPIDITQPLNTPVTLDCHESGSTLRFLLPVCAALNNNTTFTGADQLIARPLDALVQEMYIAGCMFTNISTFPFTCTGQLRSGKFELPGNTSSQYISGLLLAAPLMNAQCHGTTSILVHGAIQSLPYVQLTINILKEFGVEVSLTHDDEKDTTIYEISSRTLTSPETIAIEGDWSNAAALLSMGALSKNTVEVEGLNLLSAQGDRTIMAILSRFGAVCRRKSRCASVHFQKLQSFEIDMSDYPDLVPALAAVASVAAGTTVFKNCGRLRYKESNRLETIAATINALGGQATIFDDELHITGVYKLRGGSVSSYHDHRIVMLASIASLVCDNPVVITEAEAINKSYPSFFDDFAALGATISFD